MDKINYKNVPKEGMHSLYETFYRSPVNMGWIYKVEIHDTGYRHWNHFFVFDPWAPHVLSGVPLAAKNFFESLKKLIHRWN